MKMDNIILGQPYWCRCKRNNALVVVAFYGAGRFVEQVKGTDRNCFTQVPQDYDVLAPCHAPADVMDQIGTLRMQAAGRVG